MRTKRVYIQSVHVPEHRRGRGTSLAKEHRRAACLHLPLTPVSLTFPRDPGKDGGLVISSLRALYSDIFKESGPVLDFQSMPSRHIICPSCRVQRLISILPCLQCMQVPHCICLGIPGAELSNMHLCQYPFSLKNKPRSGSGEEAASSRWHSSA